MSQASILGARLRRLRKDAGLSQVELAADLGWSGASKVSKIETGDQMPTAQEVRDVTTLCGRPEENDELLDLLADAEVIRSDARRRAGRSQASRQVSMYERIEAASVIRDFEPMAITGILQTDGYARAIAQQVHTIYGAGDIEETVAARLRQQELLYQRDEQGRPRRRFEIITTEAALRMPPCPVQAMRRQLTKLLAILDLDNVTLAIIPMGIELPFAAFFGFLILDDAVRVEDYMGSNDIQGEAVPKFGQIFDLLMSEAVTGEDARRLIASASDSLQGGT